MSPTRLTDEERLLRSIPEKHLATDVAREAKRWHWLRYHTFRADRSPAGYPDECLVKGQRLVFAEFRAWFAASTNDLHSQLISPDLADDGAAIPF